MFACKIWTFFLFLIFIFFGSYLLSLFHAHSLKSYRVYRELESNRSYIKKDKSLHLKQQRFGAWEISLLSKHEEHKTDGGNYIIQSLQQVCLMIENIGTYLKEEANEEYVVVCTFEGHFYCSV